MPYTTVVLLLLKIILSISLDKIAQSNQLIEEAAQHYLQKNYVLALSKYESLNTDLRIKNINIRLNLAHCYFHVGDTANARKRYLPYVNTVNAEVRTVVCQQLGVLAFSTNDYKQALTYFKQALKADPQNQEARYNFELVKKLLPGQDTMEADKPTQHLPEPEPPTQIENTADEADMVPQASETNTNRQENLKQQEDANYTRQEKIRERLRKINISEDKAKMILDAMQQTEIQYIQQHKKTTTKKQDKDMPDW